MDDGTPKGTTKDRSLRYVKGTMVCTERSVPHVFNYAVSRFGSGHPRPRLFS